MPAKLIEYQHAGNRPGVGELQWVLRVPRVREMRDHARVLAKNWHAPVEVRSEGHFLMRVEP
jgi:hypothetical protein